MLKCFWFLENIFWFSKLRTFSKVFDDDLEIQHVHMFVDDGSMTVAVVPLFMKVFLIPANPFCSQFPKDVGNSSKHSCDRSYFSKDSYSQIYPFSHALICVPARNPC